MAELRLHVDMSFGARSMRCLMASAMILSAVTEVASESVTLTTYYPAPSGVYSQMITTGNTYLSRDAAGNSGVTGIGTSTPYVGMINGVDGDLAAIHSLLDVAGPARISGPIYGSYGITPMYSNWASYGTGAGGAAIYNDNGGYKTLMLVGNNSAGGTRQVSVWDQLNVNGNAQTTGTMTVGTTLRIGGVVDCVEGTCPPNNAVRLTPNFHFNSGTGYAVIANWDNGAAPAGTWEFRVGNGVGADQFYVTNTGEAVSQYRVSTDNSCSEVNYVIDGVTNCPAGQYATLTSGVISYETLMPMYTNGVGAQQGGLAPMLCCNCPVSGCPL